MTQRFFVVSLALSSALAFSSQPAFAQHRGSYAGGGGHGGYGGGAHAVPRGGGYTGGGYHGGGNHGGGYNGGGYNGGGGAAYRHPRAGTGSGYYYGNSYYGHSHGYYGHSYYGHGYYPYSGYYGSYYPYYYPYGSYGYPYFGLGLSFSWGSPSYYSAPQDGSYAAPSYAVDYSSARSDDAGNGDDRVAPARDRDSGWLRVEVRPEDTSVYVDDQFRGTGREARSLALSPGHHTIELVRPGFVTEQHEVDIAIGQRSDLLVEMRR